MARLLILLVALAPIGASGCVTYKSRAQAEAPPEPEDPPPPPPPRCRARR